MSQKSVVEITHQKMVTFEMHDTVHDVIEKLRKSKTTSKIIYFYIVDEDKKLRGVVPARRLLIAEAHQKMSEILIGDVVSLSKATSVEEVKQAFAVHRLLALPVTDENGKFIGVVDIEQFAGDLGDVNARKGFHDIYEILGLEHLTEKEMNSWRVFLMRLPWLLVTVLTGSVAAFLAGHFEHTLKEALVFAFFLTMILGLNESIAMQSVTMTVQRLHKKKLQTSFFMKLLSLELGTSLLLGMACGLIAGWIAYLWKGDGLASLSIMISLILTMIISCLWGVVVPYFLEINKKDVRVAVAPIALGLSDFTTLLFYFSIAKYLLHIAE